MFLLRGPASKPHGGSAGVPAHPPLGLYLSEPARGLADLAALPLASVWLAIAPRGDGHGVLVLPGLLAADGSTVALRQFVQWLGYDAHGWELGRNRGPTEAVLDGLPPLLTTLAERTGKPVSIIGWSLGGIYARELAREYPGLVRQVITLGSPFGLADPHRTRADGVYQRRSHLHAGHDRIPTREAVAMPIDVPSTAVYSRHDGIVCWQHCIEPETALHRNIEVRCSHLGFGFDPATLWLIADRLAQPAGSRHPFQPPMLLRPLYPGHW
jgi:pimeloyl-ACP methyl ester carboxylesterase